jgi:hypothetical protein
MAIPPERRRLFEVAERRCYEAIKEFQAGLARLAEMQPLELAEAIAEGQGLEDWPEVRRLAEAVRSATQEVEDLQDSQEE